MRSTEGIRSRSPAARSRQSGVGRSTEGGFVVSGRWKWGSGTQHCHWIGGGTIVDDGNFRLMFLPVADVEILDTWHTSGLRGTGSTDFPLPDVFAPAAPAVPIATRQAPFDRPLSRFPLFTLLSLTVRVDVPRHRPARHRRAGGAGRREDAYVREPSRRDSQPSPRSTSPRRRPRWAPPVRFCSTRWVRLGGRGSTAVTCPSSDERASGWLPPTRGSVAPRRSTSPTTPVVGLPSSPSNPLQRCFRDVHTATQHLMVSPTAYEIFGRQRLGLPLDGSLL